MDEEQRRRQIMLKKMRSVFDSLESNKPPRAIKWTSPKEIEGQPKQIYYQYHSTYDDSDTFDLLPMPYHSRRTHENGRKLSITYCENIKDKWLKFIEEPNSKYGMVHYPSGRDVEFRNYKLRFSQKFIRKNQ